MRYHGNYCGPNWSAGKVQASVCDPTVPSVDEFDETCRVHDCIYANHGDLLSADLDFFKKNIFAGFKEFPAAMAVGLQYLARLSGAGINMKPTMTRKAKNAPRQAKQLALPAPSKPKARSAKSVELTTVPSAYGFSLRMSAPKVTRSANKSSIIGADFAGTVRTAATANYQPAASILLNPAYFQNAMLGSLARAYEKYRFVKAVVQYIPSVPTSTQGQLVMCSTRTVKEPYLDGSNTTFLSRALSQGNAVATPLWKENFLSVTCGGEWNIVDSLIDGDLDDSVQEEVQVYTTCDSTVTCGILMLHYEIEFKDPLYTYHPTLIPIPVGNGSFTTLTDNVALKAVGDSVALSNSSITLPGGDGTIYRLVFRQEVSILPTGVASWAAFAKINQVAAATATTLFGNTTTIGMVPGTTLYGVITSTAMVLYDSYDTAVAAGAAGSLLHATATTAFGTYAFLISMVRLGGAARITAQ
jgi:hypothetical protein